VLDRFRSQNVVRIDPTTGTETVVATLPFSQVSPADGAGLLPGQAIVFNRSLYVLQPDLSSNLTLLRIPLPS